MDTFNYHVDSTYGPRTTTDLAPFFFLFTYPTVYGQARFVAFLEDSRFRALHSF